MQIIIITNIGKDHDSTCSSYSETIDIDNISAPYYSQLHAVFNDKASCIHGCWDWTHFSIHWWLSITKLYDEPLWWVNGLGMCSKFAILYRKLGLCCWGVVFRTLDHAFGHHSNSVLERLSLVTEPYSDDLTLVAELVCQTSDFSAWKTKQCN